MIQALVNLFLSFATVFSALNKSAKALDILAGTLETEATNYASIRAIEQEAELNARRKALKADLKVA